MALHTIAREKLWTPGQGILVVQHRQLANPGLNLEKLFDYRATSIGEDLAGRDIIDGVEGDIFQSSWSDDVLVMHGHATPSKETFEAMRADGSAAFLDEVVENVLEHKQAGNPEPVLVLEAKAPTSYDAIKKSLALLKEANLENAYIDSFFPWTLNATQKANAELGTDYKRSLHGFGRYGPLELSIPGAGNVDIMTHAYPIVFGQKLNGKPLVYGLVNSVDKAKRLAENPHTLGIYSRLGESVAESTVNSTLRHSRKKLK